MNTEIEAKIAGIDAKLAAIQAKLAEIDAYTAEIKAKISHQRGMTDAEKRAIVVLAQFEESQITELKEITVQQTDKAIAQRRALMALKERRAGIEAKIAGLEAAIAGIDAKITAVKQGEPRARSSASARPKSAQPRRGRGKS